jgi:hypothetical protein
MSFYHFVVFSLLVVYKSLILAEHHIAFARHGFALINALALAKVMLVAQELHLADTPDLSDPCKVGSRSRLCLLVSRC